MLAEPEARAVMCAIASATEGALSQLGSRTVQDARMHSQGGKMWWTEAASVVRCIIGLGSRGRAAVEHGSHQPITMASALPS